MSSSTWEHLPISKKYTKDQRQAKFSNCHRFFQLYQPLRITTDNSHPWCYNCTCALVGPVTALSIRNNLLNRMLTKPCKNHMWLLCYRKWRFFHCCTVYTGWYIHKLWSYPIWPVKPSKTVVTKTQIGMEPKWNVPWFFGSLHKNFNLGLGIPPNQSF